MKKPPEDQIPDEHAEALRTSLGVGPLVDNEQPLTVEEFPT